MRLDLDPHARNKLVAAAIALGITLTGLVFGVRWLTIFALLFWVAAIALLGPGHRRAPVSDTEEDT